MLALIIITGLWFLLREAPMNMNCAMFPMVVFCVHPKAWLRVDVHCVFVLVAVVLG